MALLDHIGDLRRRTRADGRRLDWSVSLRQPLAQVILLTLGFAAFRLASVPFVGLGVDESYTVSISHEWSLSYFDHPPLHQWIIRAFAPLLGWGRWLRLPFVALSIGTSVLTFLLTRRMFGARAGVWAALIFNLTGFFTAVAGAWILPDGPLDFCLTAAALALAGVLFPRAPQTTGAVWLGWMNAGLWIGLAGLSKYQAVLFVLGLGLFLVTSRPHRKWLTHPAPWAAAVLALAILSPVLLWNAQHDWASFRFQGGRGAASHGLKPLAPLTAIAGQAAILLPWVFAILVSAVFAAVRAGRGQAERWFLLMLAAPAIVLFTLTPVWGEHALPHWATPGWLMVVPLSGALLADACRRTGWPRAWAIGSTAALALIWPLATVEAATGVLGKALPSLKSDPTVESIEWTGLRGLVRERLASSSNCLFVAAPSWSDGGKVAQAVGDLVPVRVLSDDPRGFGFLKEPEDLSGCDALIVGRESKMTDRLTALRRQFASVRPYGVDREGRGAVELRLTVLDARKLLHPLPTPYR